ncbi:hypothetical protein ACFX13_017997 [Malus domestica]
MEMYAKWGSIDKSLEIFNGLGTKKQPLGFQSFVGLQCKEWQDKLSNRVVLENGTDWHEACDLTFIAVLTARKHYGFLTDLLGHAGVLLDEAEELIERIPRGNNEIIVLISIHRH